MLYIIGFTEKGLGLGQKIKKRFDFNAQLFQKTTQDIELGEKVAGTLEQWTREAFLNADIILFIGACGIAVRSIAPFLTDKWHDPAVLVMDEGGNHCISLLSGHTGGGNQWCEKIAEIVGASPVITTATDVNGMFAVDVFAKDNYLQIKETKLAKEVSAAVLAGEKIPLVIEEEILTINGKIELIKVKLDLDNNGISLFTEGQLKLLELQLGKEISGRFGIYVGVRKRELPFEKTLHLIPKSLILGLGCKKGISGETLNKRVDLFCREKNLMREAFCGVSTIDLKKEEPGLLEFCQKAELPLITYSPEKLCLLKGNFTASPFVEQTTGVDNVCERSALTLALEQGGAAELLEGKYPGEGVTAAAAIMQKEGLIWGRFM
ncbi:MAG: cobalamin biosynthesis protein [Roseburia sp.]|nr:cobalamin biosynthesis protein [Roseburia sp.]